MDTQPYDFLDSSICRDTLDPDRQDIIAPRSKNDVVPARADLEQLQIGCTVPE